MMKITLCLCGLALAAPAPQDGDPAARQSTPDPVAGIGGSIDGLVANDFQPCQQDGPVRSGDTSMANQKGGGPGMKVKNANAGREVSAKFKDFSGLLDRLMEPMKSDSLGVAKAAAVTGLKLSKTLEESTDYLVLYRSDRFDDLWAYGRGRKTPSRPLRPGGNEFLEAIQLRLPGPSSTSRGLILDLNLKEKTPFTVTDFDAFFQQPAVPSQSPHPVPLMAQSKQYEYKRNNMRIGLTCDKQTGYCRTIVIDNVRSQPKIPAAQKP
jgi:hypothetical protein